MTTQAATAAAATDATTAGGAGDGASSRLASIEIEANQSYMDYEGPQRYRDFPARFSLPLPQGCCGADETIELRDGRGGGVLPSHARPFLLWPDESVRAWDVWLPLNLERGGRLALEVHRGKSASELPSAAEAGPVAARVTVVMGDGVELRTEVALEPSSTDGGASAGASPPPFRLTEHDFELRAPGGDQLIFGGTLVRRSWRWVAGSEWEVRLTNHHGHDDATAVRSVRLELDLPTTARGRTRYAVRQSAFTAWGHPRLTQRDNPIDVIAEGSVRAAEAAQLGEDETRYPAYERGGYVLSVSPWLGMADGGAAWVLVMPEALERMPKAWRLEPGRLMIDLHPALPGAGAGAAPLSWRQGMTLYQRFVLLRLDASDAAREMEDAAQAWLRPPIVRVESDAYRRAGWRIPFRYRPERFPRTEFGFRDSFNFTWTYGTFDWGDQIAGDKGGAARAPGSRGVARNLEYDFPAVAANEFARTGRFQMYRMCRESAQHMMHTDFVAVSTDPWKEGGIVHHSADHTSGSAYPSHMWAEGLTLYHQLSGDPHALRVAMRVGDFYLKHIRERFHVVQATAREVGWTLIALAAIYDVTREPRYLEGIRRVVDHALDRGREDFFPTDACFTLGLAVIGLDRARHFHRDAETRRFILDLLDWMMRERRDGIGLFEYWRDPELGAIPYVQAHLPEALNIGYLLSGDDRYLRAAYRLYQVHLGGGLLTVQPRYQPPECGFAAGNHITWMGCLQSFAEQGWLDALQYREPDGAAVR